MQEIFWINSNFFIQNMLDTVAERLSAFLRNRNLKQTEFCKTTGYPESNLSNFLTGKTTNPRIELMEALANHFPELDLVWLLSGTGTMLRERAALEADKATIAELRAEEPEEIDQPITMKEIVALLKKRVNELEREIMDNNPGLAKKLGIDKMPEL